MLVTLSLVTASCCLKGGHRPTDLTGQIILREVVDCFPAGLRSRDGQTVYCETSAAVFDGKRLVLASDKPVPGDGYSAVFSFNYPGKGKVSGQPGYLDTQPFITAIKYEDMTLTTDGRYVIATTGFDRVKPDSHEWDGYNTLLYWPVGDPASVRVASPSTNQGVTSSVGLRKKISDALVNDAFPVEVPYFKVESLAAIPGNRLLFGIREMGERYDKFEYTFKILAVDFEFRNGVLTLDSHFRLVYELKNRLDPARPATEALSGLEYDPHRRSLFVLTSFEEGETDEDLGGALWSMPVSSLDTGLPPRPVKTTAGEIISFAHKSEGVAILDKHLLLVIHDDDRVLGRAGVTNTLTQFSRLPNQGAYTLVSVGEP